jgi:predicted small secreted protein
MKKIISSILVCVLLVGVIFSLVSCGNTLSGTYEGWLFDLKFKGNKVTVIAGDKQLTGTYEIEKDDETGKKTIDFDFVDEDKAEGDAKYILGIIDSLLDGDIPFAEEDGELNIGGSKFKKK